MEAVTSFYVTSCLVRSPGTILAPGLRDREKNTKKKNGAITYEKNETVCLWRREGNLVGPLEWIAFLSEERRGKREKRVERISGEKIRGWMLPTVKWKLSSGLVTLLRENSMQVVASLVSLGNRGEYRTIFEYKKL